MMSANAPAGTARKKIGSVTAVCTSATMTGVGDSEVISQPAPISCIQVPVLEISVASHSMRNSGIPSGDQGDTVAVAAEASGVGLGAGRKKLMLGCPGLNPGSGLYQGIAGPIGTMPDGFNAGIE
jgi:hypothetical protein